MRVVDRLNKESYRDFLSMDLMPYIEQHYDDGNVLLLHDNHRAHHANLVTDWIRDNIGQTEDFFIPHPP